MARTRFSELRKHVVARAGATERLAELRRDTLEEIRLYELRHGEAIRQAELAGRLDVTQGAVPRRRTRGCSVRVWRLMIRVRPALHVVARLGVPAGARTPSRVRTAGAPPRQAIRGPRRRVHHTSRQPKQSPH
jgi:hypothetical protein